MALPADMNTGTVTGRWVNFKGDPERGQVTFTPTVGRSLSQGTETIVVGSAITAVLDENGEINVVLPATNDPDLNPTDFGYKVQETFQSKAGSNYTIELEVGQTLDLSAVVVPTAPAGPSTLLLEGPPGISFTGKGYVDDTDDLPDDADRGDAYGITADGHWYIFNGTVWVDMGAIGPDDEYIANFLADAVADLDALAASPSIGLDTATAGFIKPYRKNLKLATNIATVSNTAAETSLLTGTYSIPANTLNVDSWFDIDIWGLFTNNSGSARGIIFRVKLGGTTVIQMDTGNLASNAGTRQCHFAPRFGFFNFVGDRPSGGADLQVGDAAGAVLNTVNMSRTPQAVTVDFTTALNLDITIQMSVANANVSFLPSRGTARISRMV